MRKSLLISALLLFWGATVFGQTRTVTGTVTSADDGGALPGANVLVQGTNKGTVTGVNGEYSIDLAPGETTLVVSFIGFETQTINVGERTVIDVAMKTSAQGLEEIVVVGYGTQRKSDLTGSVASVRGSDLTKIPSFNPAQALQGKVPGVQVTNTNGAPGSSPVVRVRGVGTFNDSSPIYVVDGVILTDISFLNPGDIQSMEVLKDASATAIYGSRGANGVIMITTKQGKKGDLAPTINFSAEYSLQQLQKKIDLLNGKQFATIVNEITPGSFNNVDAVANTDWQDLLFRSAPIQSYQFSASGASDRSQYYFGIGYFQQGGIIPKSEYQRLTTRFNSTYHLSKSIRVGNNLTLAPFKQQNTNGNSVFVVYRAQPTVTPYQADGSYSPVPGVGNVLADIENTNSFDKGLRTVGNLFGEVDIIKGLTFRSSFGVDMNYKKNRSFTPVFFVSPQQQNSTSRLNKDYNDQLSWLWENTINFNKDVEKHHIDLLAGYTMQDVSSENLHLQARDLTRPTEDFWYFNGSNLYVNETSNNVDLNQNFSMISYLARANYTYDNRYLFTATFRRDGSSKFTPKNKYANFPSLALGWNLINEPFMDDGPFSNLKLRASWGIIGNEKISYDKQYSLVDNNLGVVLGSGEILYPGQSYGVSGNPDLKWESTHQIDVGLEMGFLNDNLTAEIDYYNRTTKDILISLPVPSYLGNGTGAQIVYNAGEVLNKGFEFLINWRSEVNGLAYRLSANGTTIHNEAIKVRGTGGSNDYLPNGNRTTSTEPGIPIGSFYGYKVDGVFQTAEELAAYPHLSEAKVGDLRFVDTNGDGILNTNDRTNLGSPIPTFIYGLSGEASYRGFTLQVDFQGQHGNSIYNAKETVRPDLYNFEKHYINRWTGPGTSNSEPRASSGGYNFTPSSRYVQSGAYLRLRTLAINYALPKALISKASMKMATIYVKGTNVFTKSKFTGYSPEIGSENVINNGIDNGTYPIPSVYSIGLNVTF